MKEDLRVIKTRKALHEAILRLITKNDINKITIKEICDEALVNRMTFYKYYEDKYHLLNDVLQSCLKNTLPRKWEDTNLTSWDEFFSEYYSILFRIIDAIGQNKDLLNIYNTNNNIQIHKVIHDVLYMYMSSVIPQLGIKLDRPTNKILCSFMAGGCVSVLAYWAQNQENISKDSLIDYVKNIFLLAIVPKFELVDKEK